MKSFVGINSYDFFETGLMEEIRLQVNSRGKDYILGVDEEEYIKYLVDFNTIDPLEIDKESEVVTAITRKEWVDTRGGSFQMDVYYLTVKYLFTGASRLFNVRPSTWTMASEEIDVVDHAQTVSFRIRMYETNELEFKSQKNQMFERAFVNIKNINADVNNWNTRVPDIVQKIFRSVKSKYVNENNFFKAINLKTNEERAAVFSVPVVKKKISTIPSVSPNQEFSSNPIISMEMYKDILKQIYTAGKSMEQKPALYKGKDEEGLRDQFLFNLESKYDGVSVSGETFNRGGKTDIMLKYSADNSNLFVAECKFWHGIEEFFKAISQLFDRYLTWRDSKVALLIFVKTKNFTRVINTVKQQISEHAYFKSEKVRNGETSLSYIFKLPQDHEKDVFLEVMLFHYDKE